MGIREDGYHEVATVMQQISLSDDIDIEWQEGPAKENTAPAEGSKLNIRLTTNRKYLPTDGRNLAYKAALLMEKKAGEMGKTFCGDLTIDIFKRIPVAAGLAGGSGNGRDGSGNREGGRFCDCAAGGRACGRQQSRSCY